MTTLTRREIHTNWTRRKFGLINPLDQCPRCNRYIAKGAKGNFFGHKDKIGRWCN